MNGAGVIDAMLISRTVIAIGCSDALNKILGESIPLCHASNENELADWFTKLVMNPELRNQIDLKSRGFVIKHLNATDTVREIHRSS